MIESVVPEPDREVAVERDGMAWPPAEWENWKRQAARDVLADDAPRGRGIARQLLETVLLSALLFGVLRFAFQNYVVESHSMEPNLIEGQRIWVSKLDDELAGSPGRGDIVVFQSWGQDKPFVKRVVGLPGDTIEVRDGVVRIDGAVLAEPYLTAPTMGSVGPVHLAPDEVYVMGDNRGNSADSRSYGALSVSDIVGRAWLRYWPVADAAILVGTHPVLAGER